MIENRLPPGKRAAALQLLIPGIRSVLSIENLRRHLRTPLYANAYYLMANTMLNSLSGFAFWTLAARFYTADDVGIASAVISVMLLLAGLSSLGLGSGLIRFLPEAGEMSDKMLDSSLTLLTVISILAAIIFLAGLPLWCPTLTLMYSQPAFMIGFVLFVLSSAWNGVINHVFIAHRVARFSLLNSAAASIKLLLLIAFAALPGAFGIFASMGVAITIALGITLLWFLPAVQNKYFPRPRLCVGILRSLIPFSVSNYLANFLVQTPQIILPVVVLNVLGASESAHFYMAWMIATMLFMISGAISISAFAEGSNKEESLMDTVQRSSSLTALLSLPATVIVLVAGEKMLLLFGQGYAEGGSSLLSILALSSLPVGVNHIYLAVKRVKREIGAVLLLSTLIAGGTIGFGYLFMPRYGITGTGIGWLLSQAAVTGYIVCSILLKRVRNQGGGGFVEVTR